MNYIFFKFSDNIQIIKFKKINLGFSNSLKNFNPVLKNKWKRADIL